MAAAPASPVATPARNSVRRVLLASVAGTTIEFFDFYIYATASVIVFPRLFFSNRDPFVSDLQSMSTFALAFFARPLGSWIFGHFGDRVGRKATLVAALLMMGLATMAIGLLPTFASIGVLAPLLLATCRLCQGVGLGGEWGGAVLLATENAPPGRKAWFGMFPQLGAPIGFLLSSASFLLLSNLMSEEHFLGYGWRIPFLASSLLIGLGLYVRLSISETPAFAKALAEEGRVAVPFLSVIKGHTRGLVLGTAGTICTFLLFYLLTVFCLLWGTGHLGYSRTHFLLIQMTGMVFFGALIPCSAVWADRKGQRHVLMVVTVLIAVYGLAFGPLLGAGPAGVLATTFIGFTLMGITYGPIGTFLAGLFPTTVRYTGSSLAFNLAGILGASYAPRIATELATRFGLPAVGYYLTAAALISLAGLAFARPRVEA
jgi:metabolite-proton symporter